MKKTLFLLLALMLVLSLAAPAFAAEDDAVEVLTQALDYSDAGNWAYYESDGDKGADVFLLCPVVDIESYANALELTDELKAAFLYALDLEKGIYAGTGRMFSPYYRQMSINAYTLPEAERAQAMANAFLDVSAAFRWYLDHENNGRPLILAGFSQGAEMCFELLKAYYGGDSPEAQALRDRLVAVYGIGWSVTKEMTDAFPQIVPARGETDTGVVISFDCEDGSLTDSLIIPAGVTALSINPLNWRTDSTAADRSLNLGAVMEIDADPIPALCGAYIGGRGELVATDVTAEDYPPVLDVFQPGSYHIYDYLFFFTNLKNNVADRTAAWASGTPFKDVTAGAWYAEAVKAAYDAGLMTGTGPAAFSPKGALTRAELVTILWRMEGKPAAGDPAFRDVPAGQWYTGAVGWAAEREIAAGYSPDAFGPTDRVSREQLVTILHRYAQSKGRDVNPGEDDGIQSYDDASAVSAWAMPAMRWACGADILRGKAAGILAPKDSVTRAETAAMLTRFQAAPNGGGAAEAH